MNVSLLFLLLETLTALALVLTAHGLRKRFGPGPLYGLLGLFAALMVFSTDTAAAVQWGPFHFLVGSTVFFPALLAGVFLLYVFDGPASARAGIGIVLLATFLTPLVATLLNWHLSQSNATFSLLHSNLRVYFASPGALFGDFLFLAVSWQFLANRFFKVPLSLRVILVFVATLYLDALLFVPLAFWGESFFNGVFQANLLTRFFLALCLLPFLIPYLGLFRHELGLPASRHALAILQRDQNLQEELNQAREEIQRREEIEIQLRESEERGMALLTATPVGILIVDPQRHVVVDVNPAACSILEGPPEQIVGKGCREILCEDVENCPFDPDHPDSYGNQEETLTTLTGRKVPVLKTLVPVVLSGTSHLLESFIDISERKRAEEELENSKRMLEVVLDTVPERVFWKDRDSRFLGCNAAFAEDAGLQSPDEIIGKYDREMSWGDIADAYRKDDLAVLESGKAKLHYEEPFQMADGTQGWVYTSKVPLRDNTGHVFGVLGAFHDITERRRMEEALSRRDDILEAVSFVAEHFLQTERFQENVETALEKLGEATRSSRVYIFENGPTRDNGDVTMNQRYEWTAEDVEAQIDNPDLQEVLYRETGFGRWMETFLAGKPVYGHVRDFPEGERALLEPQAILSIAVVPIWVGGQWWGFLGFDDCRWSRDWSPVEVDALRTAAGALGAAIQRQRDIRALGTSEERLELVLKGANLGYWDWELPSGQVIFNARWGEILGLNTGEMPVDIKVWQERIHPEDKDRVFAALQKHMSGESATFACEYRLQHKEGHYVWILGQGRIVQRDGEGQPFRMAGTMADIMEKVEADRRLAEAQANEKELESRIEESLLKGHLPRQIQGGMVDALSISSLHMDGDFFDFFSYTPHCFDLVVGDVMGKGIQAALIGAGAKTRFLRAIGKLALQVKEGGFPPLGRLVDRVQQEIAPQLMELERFITLSYTRFHLDKGLLEFVNCGHTHTMHYDSKSGQCRLLGGENMPLGFVESQHIHVMEAEVQVGDCLLFYSDGVTEAASPEGELFQTHRLLDFLAHHQHLPPDAIIQELKTTVEAYTQSSGFSDDFTCIVLKLLPPYCFQTDLSIPGSLTELHRVRDFVQENALKTQQFTEVDGNLLTVGVQETVVNIITHEFKRQVGKQILLEGLGTDKELTFRLTYPGQAFNLETVPEPNLEKGHPESLNDHGRGVYIIRQIFNEARTRQIAPDRARIELVKTFSSGEE